MSKLTDGNTNVTMDGLYQDWTIQHANYDWLLYDNN